MAASNLAQMAQMPVGLDSSPMDYAPQLSSASLAGLLPQTKVPKPSKFTAGNILGVLGDALMAYGHMQPTFGPMLQARQMDNEQFNRQMQLAQAQAQLKMMYPDGEFERELMQGGVMPGTQAWQQAMKTKADNALNPAIMTPYGLMLRSQAVGASNAKPLSDDDIDRLSQGGQTPPASGGFPGR